MDLWVVAAAAGAGYLAKYWQNIFRDREGLLGFTCGGSAFHNPAAQSSIQLKNDETYSIGNLSPIRRVNQYLGQNNDENNPADTLGETSRRDGPTTTEVTSTSTLDHGKQLDEHKDGNLPCSPVFPAEHDDYEYERSYKLDSDLNDIPEYQVWETGISHSPRKSGNVLRSKHRHMQFIKPRSSLESCVVAQMYRENAEIEDYVLSPLASPCAPTIRPFLVTDGRRLIGRASGTYRDRLHREGYLNASDGVVGVPYLPQIKAANLSKQKINKGRTRFGKTSKNSDSMHFDARDGSPSGEFLFCLGISVGVMYTIMAQKLEVKQLRDSLKQSENLIQDLQEELEMKDSLTVKELAIDDSSQDAHESSFVDKELNMFSKQVNTNALMKCADEESVSLKDVDSMSKIEAELEAELERLELSMNGTSLQGKLSGDTELERDLFDEDIVAELVQGELRANLVRGKSCSEPTPDRGSSHSTPLSANYCVSPRELSLRLHEVIQSRLQERIRELESELAKRQKRVWVLESERVNSWKEVWNSESSSNASTPVVVEAHSPGRQPLVMNLSGDALDAYNEACEELSKIKGSQNEDSIRANGEKDSQLATHHVSNGKQNDNQDYDLTWLKLTGEEPPMPNGRTEMIVDEVSSNVNERSRSRNEDNDGEDDLLLIKQIVEKARQGSPAILRAQRALVYLEGEE